MSFLRDEKIPKSENFQQKLADADFLCALAFLTDITKHLNNLNLRLQGKQQKIATLLGDAGDNILEVSHHRMFLDIPAKGASLDIVIETKDAAHARKVLKRIQDAGFEAKQQLLGSRGEFGSY